MAQHLSTRLSPVIQTFRAFDMHVHRGKMAHIWDEEGNKYVDHLSQNHCISVGHSHPYVSEKVKEQVDLLPHCTTMFKHRSYEKLSDELHKFLDSDEYVVHPLNSGAEAVDLAIRMAMKYTDRRQFLSLKNSFHGLQGLAADATEMKKFRQFNSRYAKYIPQTGFNPDHFLTKAGIIVEPVQGYGGVYPVKNIEELFQYAKDAGGVTICDEIQTGIGKLGKSFFGYQRLAPNLDPDIIVLGKGLGNGFPISCVISKRHIAEKYAMKPFFNTYACNPIGCVAATATLEVLQQDRLIENCDEVGTFFMEELKQLQTDYPKYIKDVRGFGLLIGVELNPYYSVYIQRALYSLSFATEFFNPILNTIKYPEYDVKGHIVGLGGKDKNIMRIQPPLSIELDDAIEFIDKLDAVLSHIDDTKN